ncbi:MAG: Eco57I restriction-modification methylase domain-containing protein [Promethearchaeia archaeon]
MKITYDNLIKKLNEKYEKVNENEFIIKQFKRTGQDYKLKVIKNKNLKKAVNELEELIVSHQKEAEKSKIVYGIVFSMNNIVFLRLQEDILQKVHIQKLKRNLNKITPAFKKKYKAFLQDPGDMANWDQLYDRTDIIEEFYILYSKAKEKLMKNIQGIHDDIDKEEFADNLLVQLLIIWYLQEKKFLNSDKNYLINRFKDFKSLGYRDFYSFLKKLFNIMMNTPTNGVFNDESNLGKIVVTGTAPFINGDFENLQVKISDDTFYVDGETEILQRTPPEKISEVSILNLLESRDWTEGNIDEYVLGAIYEKLITQDKRKKTGAYYTPKKITLYISENCIEKYLLNSINSLFKTSYKSIYQMINDLGKEGLLKLFEILKNLKIVDPAVGSAHFLESSIDMLLKLYKLIRDKLNSLGNKNKLLIKIVDHKGNIENINLIDINDENKFNLFVKFFIILSKNIYGVDINKSALKIARARLFLSLAKHFDVEKNYFIMFPNVHFNLRYGNSLLGYIKLFEKGKPEKEKQTPLDFFLKEKDKIEIDKINKKLKLVRELKDYLILITKKLDIKIDLIENIKRINVILNKEQISQNDFKRILLVKESLVQILIASLNSNYALYINDFLNQLSKFFYLKLDIKFAKNYEINLEDLLKLGTFHWIFEFPEVFMDNNGFDIVLGNPPYLKQGDINKIIENVNYKDILSKIYTPYSDSYDFSIFFILRSLEIVKKKGIHSFIITNKWLRAKYGEKIRKLIKESYTIYKLIDFNGIKVFIGPTVDTLIYVIIKQTPKNKNIFLYNKPLNTDSIEENYRLINQSDLKDPLWNFIDKENQEIINWIRNISTSLKDLNINVYRGVTTGFNDAFIINQQKKKSEFDNDKNSLSLIKPLIRGSNIKKYYIEWNNEWLIFTRRGIDIYKYKKIKNYLEKFKDKLKPKPNNWKGKWNGRKAGNYKWFEIQDNTAYYTEFEKPKIISTKAAKEPSFYLDYSNIYILNTSYVITSKSKKILAILNSSLSKYFLKLTGSKLSNNFEPKVSELQEFPITKNLNNIDKKFDVLIEYIIFLKSSEERRINCKKIIDFFENQLIDYLIYEFYFKKKFYQDSIYIHSEKTLLDMIAKYIISFDFIEWNQIFWNNKFQNNLNENEKSKLEKVEKNIMKLIEKVYNNIERDINIKKQLNNIKNHPWIKQIELIIN